MTKVEGTELQVRIIAIGDELLEGRTIDSNSQRIQRALGRHAVQIAGIEVVPDQGEAITSALERTEPGNLVFMTGGLGSTPDDLTREAVAKWAGAELIEDTQIKASLESRWRKMGFKIRVGVNGQFQVPLGMTPLSNPVGSAPGLVGQLRERTLVVLPGVPDEVQGLLPSALDYLAHLKLLPQARPMMFWRTAQVAEMTIVETCAHIRKQYPELVWSWWLCDWGVDMRVAARNESNATDLVAAGQEIDQALGHLVYSREQQDLPEVIQSMLINRQMTLSVAESCTAGLIGASMTEQAGSSGFFRGGIIAYDDKIKQELLGVPEQVLKDHGSVSCQTVAAMAKGCRKKLKTDYAIAVSGVSGPDGGTQEKPVGTTWIAIATPSAVFTNCYRFPAKRSRNRLLTVASANDSLRRVLEFGDDQSPWQGFFSWCQAVVENTGKTGA